jgi:dihydroflavonol-4-reductase
MTDLVTGASGHIGAHVIRHLLAQGRAVRALVRATSNLQGIAGLDVEIARGDVRDRGTLVAALKGCSVVYHLAAVVAEWAPDPSLILETAIDGTANLLQAIASVSGIERVVYTSSVAAVGMSRAPGEWRNEAHYTREDTTHYSVAKTRAELMARELAAERGIPLIIVNPAVVLGSLDYRRTPAMQIIIRFLRHHIPFYYTGGVNIVHVDDVARGHLLAAHKGVVGERYILGGDNLTVLDFLSLLGDLTGRPSPRIEVGQRTLSAVGWGAELLARLQGSPPFITRARAQSIVGRYAFYDSAKARQTLGYTARPAREVLQDAVRWVRGQGWA